MKIGIPREIKKLEKRVAVTPAGVETFVAKGHTVYVETGAGAGLGISDEIFQQAGAAVLSTADDVWHEAEMIIKVKEPVEPEFDRMKPGQILFTYLHLAADSELTRKLLGKK